MANNRLFLSLSIFCGLAILLLLFFSDPGATIHTDSPTSYSVQPGGTKIFYKLLTDNGYNVERWRKKINSVPVAQEAQSIIMIAPSDALSSQETDFLISFIHQGHTAFLFYSSALDDLLQKLHVRCNTDSSMISFPSGYLGNTVSGDTLNPHIITSDSTTHARFDDEYVYFNSDSSAIMPLYSTLNGHTALEIHHGQGKLIIFNSPNYVTNAGLQLRHNADIIFRILEVDPGGNQREPGIIYWDEYHHGYKDYESLVAALDTWPIKWGMILSTISLLLWVHARAKRWGRPVPVITSSRRASIDYVHSVSGVYQNSSAHTLALHHWYQWVMADLQRRYATRDPDKLALILHRRFALDIQKTKKLFAWIDRKTTVVKSPDLKNDPVQKREVSIDDEELIAGAKQLDHIYFLHYPTQS